MTELLDDLPDHYSFLRQFYVTHFPIEEIFQMFEINENREFSAQLSNRKIVRYMSFSTSDKLREWLLRTCPLKLDLGCEYEDLNIRGGAAELREFAIDVDMGDYSKKENQIKKVKRNKKTSAEHTGKSVPFQPDRFENIHFCGKLCDECMMQMSQVINMLYHVLYHNLGFRNILFFFSGNKGFHCYILDETAKQFSNYLRESIVIYLKSFGIIGDLAVSKDIKHLLKCPFVVHPKTGLVCLPIIRNEVNEIWEIDLVHVKDVVEGTCDIGRYTQYLHMFNKRKK